MGAGGAVVALAFVAWVARCGTYEPLDLEDGAYDAVELSPQAWQAGTCTAGAWGACTGGVTGTCRDVYEDVEGAGDEALPGL